MAIRPIEDAEDFQRYLHMLMFAIDQVMGVLEHGLLFVSSSEETSLHEKSLQELIDLMTDCWKGDVDCDKYRANLRRKVQRCVAQVKEETDEKWVDLHYPVLRLESLLETKPPYQETKDIVQFLLRLHHLIARAHQYQTKPR